MRILVVGGGGREHAIIKKLAENKKVCELFVCPGNAGISSIASCVNIKATDIDGVVSFCKENKIDFVVVAPDDPLIMGMTDRLRECGIACFGPSKAAAQIEGSKGFSKKLMQKYGIKTASFAEFTDEKLAKEYLKTQSCPIVIKADGPALGKGVVIAESLEEAEKTIDEMMVSYKFGDSGKTVVIEEFLTGVEVSVLAFTDGKTIVPMVSAMDHKRIFDGDCGSNTGGMGTVAPNPFYTPDIAKQCMESIFLPTIKAMESEGTPFAGCLFFGLMIVQDVPYVIEYNCRFGDPETQVVLPLLKTDLLDIMLAVSNGTLDKIDIEFEEKSACCVIVSSGNYPQKPDTGHEITLFEDSDDLFIYHSGTTLEDGVLKNSGGRVLGVTAKASNLKDAQELAYSGVSKVHFENMHYRKDIGERALQNVGL